jgi:hypothetical protein
MKRTATVIFQRGEIVSHAEMCMAVSASLQRGMNFRLPSGKTVILMNRRYGAPYDDQVSEDGKRLIYEGHDCRKSDHPYPKQVDQPEKNPGGTPTQNGLFVEAVRKFKEDGEPPEKVLVFEKIRDGIWVYNGIFELIDYSIDTSTGRRIFKFELAIAKTEVKGLEDGPDARRIELAEDDRIIPSWVKLQVWKRDGGKCVMCGAQDQLHFDHIIPYSKGGSSKDPANIQILCLRHNLLKRDNIE